MAIIAYPANLLFGTFEPGQQRFDLVSVSEPTGYTRDRIIAPPRWTFRIGPPQPVTLDQLGLWKGMVLSLQGGFNQLAISDPGQPTPRGTLRGSLSVSGTLARGATTITLAVSGQSGATVLPGDAFQIGTGLNSQFIYASSSATASGSNVTFNFQAPARVQFSGGTTVAWNSPVAHCKLKTSAPSWLYQPGGFVGGGMVLDFIEYWEH